MGIKAEDFREVLESMSEVWPEIQGDKRHSINVHSWGYSPFSWSQFFFPIPLLSGSTWYVRLFRHSKSLTTAMLKFILIKTGLLQGWGWVLEAPVFGSWGSWGSLGVEEVLEKGSREKG